MTMESNYLDEVIVITWSYNNIVNKYNGFIINRFKFHIKEYEKLRKIQNNGIMVEVDGKIYYNEFMDIFELDYYEKFNVVLFRYDWVDINLSRDLK